MDDEVPSLEFLCRHRPDAVSRREREVVCCIANGMRNREIAAALAISPHTVRHHITHIRRKLHATRRLEVITFARQTGLV